MRCQSVVAALHAMLVCRHKNLCAGYTHSLGNSNLHDRGLLRRSGDCQIHLPARISCDMKVVDVIFGHRFDEHALPDAAAGTIPDVRGIEGLLAYGDDVAICRVVDEDDAKDNSSATIRSGQKGDYVQLVMLVLTSQVIGHIHSKS